MSSLRADDLPVTYHEQVSMNRWGAYMTALEDAMIRQAIALAGPPGRALDIGCDGGRWTRLLSQHGWRMTCTDISSESVRLCQRRNPEAHCILVRPEDSRLPAEAAELGLLTCIEVPPAVESAWFIPETARVLRPGGLLVGVFWNVLSLRGFASRLYTSLRGRQGEYHLAYHRWRRKLRAGGFDLVREEGFCWFPFRRASNSPLIPAAVAVEKALGLRVLPSLSPWVLFIARRT